MLFTAEKLNLIYDQDKETQTYAVKNIDLTIERSKFIGILGPSGSGKSSLLYLLSGLKLPTSGSVSYKEQDLAELTDQERANLRKQEFGFVFQEHFLIEYLPVLDNVLAPVNEDSPEWKARARELLQRLGIEDLAEKKPHELAGGQRQKVAIARALINKPEVLFADELTANLDHDNAWMIMDLLTEYLEEATLIVVTHDPTILQNADKIIKLWDGQIKTEADQS